MSLLPLTFAYKNIHPPASLSRGGSFKITVVSTGGMGKGKEKYYRMGMWLFPLSLAKRSPQYPRTHQKAVAGPQGAARVATNCWEREKNK